jgi:ABC-2 type transport system ATP-binding protein
MFWSSPKNLQTNGLRLDAKGIVKRYGGQAVLNGVDLQIAPGEIVGLVGRNGSGKTTLMRALLGIIECDGGEAQVFGKPALKMSDATKARLAFVPQQPNAFASMKVDEMLNYIGGFYPTWDKAYAQELREKWRLPGDKILAQLSPGERQALELIRAMATQPQLLVLDEPAAALDPAARRELLREIALHAADLGSAVLFSTHIVSDLERVASRIVYLNQGRVLFDALTDDLKERFARIVVPAFLLNSAN